MITKVMSATTFGILPLIYLSGSNTTDKPLFAVMSLSPLVCILLMVVAAVATAVSFRPKLLEKTSNWTIVSLTSIVLLTMFGLSLISQHLSYSLTYYIEPLDLIVLAELATVMLLSAVMYQPAQKPLAFTIPWWRNLRLAISNWSLNAGLAVRQLFSASSSHRRPRTF